MDPDQPEAGPSRNRHTEPYRVPVPENIASNPNVEYMTIPSFEYFKYRRALFLAGLEPYPLPTPTPAFITVPKPPPPVSYTRPTSIIIEGSRYKKQAEAVEILERQLDRPRANQHAFVKARVDELDTYLRSGKKMVKGTTLTFIVLKYCWIEEGLWPLDPVTGEPVMIADSPIQTEVSLPNVEEEGSASTAADRT